MLFRERARRTRSDRSESRVSKPRVLRLRTRRERANGTASGPERTSEERVFRVSAPPPPGVISGFSNFNTTDEITFCATKDETISISVLPHGLKASGTTRSKRFQNHLNTTTQRRTKKIVIYRIRYTVPHHEFPGSGPPTFAALYSTNCSTRSSFVNISHTCLTCIRIIGGALRTRSLVINCIFFLYAFRLTIFDRRALSRFSPFSVGNTLLFDVFVLREPRYRSAMFGLVKANRHPEAGHRYIRIGLVFLFKRNSYLYVVT